MTELEKRYVAAPLPFQGQKRRHVREFTRIINTIHPDTVVDLFGGSSLLSHLAKRASPKSRVIYNDYDNYCERLAHIEQTNELLRYFRELLHDFPQDAKILGKPRELILKRLEVENAKGYVDWITISTALLFSMRYAINFEEITKGTLYNKVRMFDYHADGYLNGLEVVRADYRELCAQYRNTAGTLFLIDPPYLSTDVKTYNSAEYWTLSDYLDVLKELNDINFIYFTSEKSQIVELSKWLDDNASKIQNIFKGVSVNTVKSPTSGKNSYNDIMLYKLNLK
jgi:site-specific DNA-adenine methylase